MNRFGAIFLMVLSTSFAEPPSYSYTPTISSTYGAPQISTTYGAPSGWESVSSGYSYEPSVASTHYTQQSIGHIPSEGAYIDHNLLEKVKQVLLQHEQSSGSAVTVISRPSSSYGPPKSTYGPPSGWQQTGWTSKVTDLHFDHPVQSKPAAYYVGYDTYAPAQKGWQPASSGWESLPVSKGWQKASSGWETVSVSKGWQPESKGWTQTVAIAPSSTYGAPKW